MEQRQRRLIEQGDQLFAKRSPLMSLLQEIGDHFYPERAMFTATKSLGEEFADHLTTSYPVIARRELGDTFSSMLRPKDASWFFVKAAREDRMAGDDTDGRGWLEWATGVQRRAMYDIQSGFVRATKEGDQDFAAFGQAAISIELGRGGDTLLYRCWHLRDVAWRDGYNGRIGPVHRKWKPTIVDLKAAFGGKVSPKVDEKLRTAPFEEIECRHIVVPSEEYEGKWRTPYVSVYIDMTHEHVIEEVGSWTPIYVIPRWQTVSGSQYAYSPATVAALPDARLIQAMTLTLLEAGEKAADPPLVATQEAVRTDLDTRAGGVTWVDSEYDEKLGAALRALDIDRSGLQFGVDMHDRVRVAIHEAFYLNKLNMPPAGQGDMTAFEVGQRIQEYIRNALPIFEPVENDYNGGICEQTFEMLLRNGAFGRPQDIPESLQGQEIAFRFESPLSQMSERRKGQEFMEAKALVLDTAAFDPSVMPILDATTALRDVLKGIGTAAKWIRSEEQVAASLQAQQQANEATGMMAAMTQGSEIAKNLGSAAGGAAKAIGTIVPEGAAA
jgi:hypothetical protein